MFKRFCAKMAFDFLFIFEEYLTDINEKKQVIIVLDLLRKHL